MSRLKEIHDYLISVGKKEKDLLEFDHYSVYLSMEICEYAHRNQKRENGEDYANHPFRCLAMYREFVGIIEDDPFCIDKDMMFEHGIPFDGVQELCLLHDVIEDTDFSIEDLEEIFDECGLKTYFDLYIKYPLIALTHDKSEEYDDYIIKCLEYPASALVKMIDMQDNINVMTLISLDKDKYIRGLKYYHFTLLINTQYHFLEENHKYREKFACNA